MAFEDCINSVRGEMLSDDEADELITRFRAMMAGREAEPGAAKKAAEALKAEYDRDAFLARLRTEKADEILDHLRSYRDEKGRPDVKRAAESLLENRNNELAGAASVVGRRAALVGWAHGLLSEYLHDYRRRFFSVGGRRQNLARLDHVVDEAFGANTGDAAARGFVDAWRKTADALVDRFNAAGGALQKMENYFPQSHDARRLSAAGRQAWKDFVRPLLDRGRMADPLTGGPLSGSRLEEALDVVWTRIVTNGALEREPSMQAVGRGSLANQRQEERFLVFRDADAWRAYAGAFGNGDTFATMMNHLHGLAKDVAALEILGPNPNATVEWMTQVIRNEAAKAKAGAPSLYTGSLEQSKLGEISTSADRVKDLWMLVNGGATASSLKVADVADTMRNITTAALLGGTFAVSVVGDPWQQAWASRFAGVPAFKALRQLPKVLFRESSRREIDRAGLIIADALDTLATSFRDLSWTARSKEASAYLPDRAFTWSGLTPFTRAERRANAVAFMADAADRVGQSLDEMPRTGIQGDRFARWLRGFGIDDAGWDRIRAVPLRPQGRFGALLGPADVFTAAEAAGDQALFDLGLRYSEALQAFVEELTPEGTARARRALGRTGKKGTLADEFFRQTLSYMVYPTTVLFSLIRATAQEAAKGPLRGAAFLASAVTSLTIGGAMVLEMKALRRTEDLEPVDNVGFWLRAFAQGGALGYYGDWIFADYKRGTGDVASRFAGPVGNMILSAVGAVGGIKALSGEPEVNVGARSIGWARSYIPIQSMWWVRPAMDHLVWQQLQRLVDPKADAAFKRRMKALEKDRGRGYWWRPGAVAPDRMPDFSLIERNRT